MRYSRSTTGATCQPTRHRLFSWHHESPGLATVNIDRVAARRPAGAQSERQSAGLRAFQVTVVVSDSLGARERLLSRRGTRRRLCADETAARHASADHGRRRLHHRAGLDDSRGAAQHSVARGHDHRRQTAVHADHKAKHPVCRRAAWQDPWHFILRRQLRHLCARPATPISVEPKPGRQDSRAWRRRQSDCRHGDRRHRRRADRGAVQCHA